jgi:hypothetical protein
VEFAQLRPLNIGLCDGFTPAASGQLSAISPLPLDVVRTGAPRSVARLLAPGPAMVRQVASPPNADPVERVGHDNPPNGTPDNSDMSFFHVVRSLALNLPK